MIKIIIIQYTWPFCIVCSYYKSGGEWSIEDWVVVSSKLTFKLNYNLITEPENISEFISTSTNYATIFCVYLNIKLNKNKNTTNEDCTAKHHERLIRRVNETKSFEFPFFNVIRLIAVENRHKYYASGSRTTVIHKDIIPLPFQFLVFGGSRCFVFFITVLQMFV